MQTIAEQIDAFPEQLSPLKEAANRYAKHPSVVSSNGAVNIGHRPWVAKLNYMLMMYPGINAEALNRYCQRFELQVPTVYAAFLQAVNGGYFFGMKLCGVPLSMLASPALLDRSVLQCHDLATAATQWSQGYNVPSGSFHFGGRSFSRQENVGYFFHGENQIISVYGKNKIVGEWTSFSNFLSEELTASEKLEEELRPAKWNR